MVFFEYFFFFFILLLTPSFSSSLSILKNGENITISEWQWNAWGGREKVPIYGEVINVKISRVCELQFDESIDDWNGKIILFDTSAYDRDNALNPCFFDNSAAFFAREKNASMAITYNNEDDEFNRARYYGYHIWAYEVKKRSPIPTIILRKSHVKELFLDETADDESNENELLGIDVYFNPSKKDVKFVNDMIGATTWFSIFFTIVFAGCALLNLYYIIVEIVKKRKVLFSYLVQGFLFISNICHIFYCLSPRGWRQVLGVIPMGILFAFFLIFLMLAFDILLSFWLLLIQSTKSLARISPLKQAKSVYIICTIGSIYVLIAGALYATPETSSTATIGIILMIVFVVAICGSIFYLGIRITKALKLSQKVGNQSSSKQIAIRRTRNIMMVVSIGGFLYVLLQLITLGIVDSPSIAPGSGLAMRSLYRLLAAVVVIATSYTLGSPDLGVGASSTSTTASNSVSISDMSNSETSWADESGKRSKKKKGQSSELPSRPSDTSGDGSLG